MSLWELMDKGGALMVPILVAFFVASTTFLVRVWFLQRRLVLPDGFLRALKNLLARGRAADAETLCAENGSAIAKVVGAGLRLRDQGRERMKTAMEELGRLQVARLSRFVNVVGTVATIAPLLGLLGTVTGMIKVFKDVAQQADPQIGVLARGIWEALLTTGAGLTVAIPSYIAYRYLLSRVEHMSAEMEEQALEVLDATPARAASPEAEA